MYPASDWRLASASASARSSGELERDPRRQYSGSMPCARRRSTTVIPMWLSTCEASRHCGLGLYSQLRSALLTGGWGLRLSFASPTHMLVSMGMPSTG